jgi:hypothetical protein
MRDRDDEELLLRTTGASLFAFVSVHGDNPMSLGTGTLVRFGDHVGLLTCGHVSRALAEAGDFYLICYRQRSNDRYKVRIKYEHCKSIEIFDGVSRTGPDLAFLELSAFDLSNVNVFATTQNGERMALLSDAAEPQHDRRFDLITGVIAEWTETPTNTGSGVRVDFLTLANIGECALVQGADGFDLAEFTPSPEQRVKLPSSYRGTSGGGWWRFFLKGEHLVEARLLGVAFYEEDAKIVCHGPSSVYCVLRQRIEGQI